MSDESSQQEKRAEAPIAGIGTMVFGKWDATEVTCSDPGLAPYINLNHRNSSQWGKARKRMVRQVKTFSS